MAHEIDVRGLSCPQPVMQVRNAIKKNDFPIVVLSDTVAACDNMRRVVEVEGLRATVEESGDEFKLTIDNQ